MTSRLARWPGKPYSGRIVLKDGADGLWYAHCERCDWPRLAMGATTMQDAFWLARDHSTRCPGEVDEPTA